MQQKLLVEELYFFCGTLSHQNCCEQAFRLVTHILNKLKSSLASALLSPGYLSCSLSPFLSVHLISFSLLSRPLADSEKLPVRTHRPEVLKSPAEDRDIESIPQESKKKSSKEKKEKKKDKEKDRKVR